MFFRSFYEINFRLNFFVTAVLRLFDNIECEWPLFYSYLAIINIFAGNMVQAEEFCHLLEDLTVAKDGAMLVPELYLVPEESISAESQAPGSSERVPGGRCPFMWAQSLLVISKLLLEDHLSPSELDPLNRRISAFRKPAVSEPPHPPPGPPPGHLGQERPDHGERGDGQLVVL